VKNCRLLFLTNPPLSRVSQSATTKYQDAPHFYESCQKISWSSTSSRFYVSASNNGLLCPAFHSLSWSPKVKCAHK